MRYHFDKPEIYLSLYGERYICEHPVYNTPIYFGSLVSGKLRSISGAANSVNTTAANEIAYAKANGNDWYTEVLADRLLLQDLLVSTVCRTHHCRSSDI